VAKVGISFHAILMLFLGFFLLVFPSLFVSLFTDQPEIIELFKESILVITIFFISDSTTSTLGGIIKAIS
jgi:Na+-driven multidrug efflux pump